MVHMLWFFPAKSTCHEKKIAKNVVCFALHKLELYLSSLHTRFNHRRLQRKHLFECSIWGKNTAANDVEQYQYKKLHQNLYSGPALPVLIRAGQIKNFKTSASFSLGAPNTEKMMKARRRRRSAFIVSRCLEPLMKNEAKNEKRCTSFFSNATIGNYAVTCFVKWNNKKLCSVNFLPFSVRTRLHAWFISVPAVSEEGAA